MTAPSFELPAVRDLKETSVQEAREPIDAQLRGTYLELVRSIAVTALDDFINDPSSQVKDFIEHDYYSTKSDPAEKTHLMGKVPTDDGSWESVDITIHKPGRLVNGLHKAIGLIRPIEPARASLFIKNNGPYVPRPAAQLKLFSTE